jgi:hypothetical protein
MTGSGKHSRCGSLCDFSVHGAGTSGLQQILWSFEAGRRFSITVSDEIEHMK